MSETDDLVTRARDLGAPMLAPEPAIARRSVLLLALADRVEELEGLLRECEWKQTVHRHFGEVVGCGWCKSAHYAGHAPGCRLARALAPAAAGGEGGTIQ